MLTVCEVRSSQAQAWVKNMTGGADSDPDEDDESKSMAAAAADAGPRPAR